MRVVLADSESRVRFALLSLLEEQSGVTVVGEASDCQGLLAQTRVACPDLVLIDWDLPGMTGSDVIAELQATCPHVRTIALGSRPEAEPEALAAGVDSFVSKAGPPEPLLAAIHLVQELYGRRERQ